RCSTDSDAANPSASSSSPRPTSAAWTPARRRSDGRASPRSGPGKFPLGANTAADRAAEFHRVWGSGFARPRGLQLDSRGRAADGAICPAVALGLDRANWPKKPSAESRFGAHRLARTLNWRNSSAEILTLPLGFGSRLVLLYSAVATPLGLRTPY